MDVSLHRLFLGRKALEQVLDALVHNKIAPGEKGRELVQILLNYLRCYHGWAFSSSVLAVRHLFGNLQLAPGDAVILSPLAPSYYQEVLKELGARILFCDVLPHSSIFDPASLEPLLLEKPLAIVLDSCLGLLQEYDFFQKLGILLIEDVTFGLGGTRNLHLAGRVGDIVVFSFAPQTLISCGQGAFLAIRSKHHREKYFFHEPSPWVLLGDLNSSLGIAQWVERDKVIEKKKEYFHYLFRCLNQQYKVPKWYGDCEVVPPWFVILAETRAKDIISYARKNGVASDWAFRLNWSWNPAIEMDCFPKARELYQQALAFPLYANLSAKELKLLGKVLATLP